MTFTSLKIAGLSVMAVGLTAGAAYAGGGKDCADKNHTAMKTESTITATPATAVLNASERTAKAKKVYTFEQAQCQAKGVSDLQACIDYKTGKTTVKPQS